MSTNKADTPRGAESARTPPFFAQGEVHGGSALFARARACIGNRRKDGFRCLFPEFAEKKASGIDEIRNPDVCRDEIRQKRHRKFMKFGIPMSVGMKFDKKSIGNRKMRIFRCQKNRIITIMRIMRIMRIMGKPPGRRISNVAGTICPRRRLW